MLPERPLKLRAPVMFAAPATVKRVFGLEVPMPTLPPVNNAEYVPLLNVCVPVHVGAIDCESAGVASDRMAVVAEPLTAVRPIDPVGFANPPNEPGRSEAEIVPQAGDPELD